MLTVELIPDFEKEAEELGYKNVDDESEDFEEVYYEQGMDSVTLTVSPGSEFEVPLYYKGNIDNKEGLYEIISAHSGRIAFEQDNGIITLSPAAFEFSEDGRTIKELRKLWQ
ncbi:MAG TPA: hypothetical protein VI757_05495 [Bacteroidia bacterium]|nr:hypothetical protein [Bacteroidia bacterium]